MAVIPGLPKGQDPEALHTDLPSTVAGRCSWFPGSRTTPAPRN